MKTGLFLPPFLLSSIISFFLFFFAPPTLPVSSLSFFPTSGEVKLLVSSEIPIEGRKMSFVNDLTITQDGKKIYFTDSSSKWQRRDYLLLVMEGTDDGR